MYLSTHLILRALRHCCVRAGAVASRRLFELFFLLFGDRAPVKIGIWSMGAHFCGCALCEYVRCLSACLKGYAPHAFIPITKMLENKRQAIWGLCCQHMAIMESVRKVDI